MDVRGRISDYSKLRGNPILIPMISNSVKLLIKFSLGVSWKALDEWKARGCILDTYAKLPAESVDVVPSTPPPDE